MQEKKSQQLKVFTSADKGDSVDSKVNVFKNKRNSAHKVDLTMLDFQKLGQNSEEEETKPKADIIKYVYPEDSQRKTNESSASNKAKGRRPPVENSPRESAESSAFYQRKSDDSKSPLKKIALGKPPVERSPRESEENSASLLFANAKLNKSN